MENIKKIISDSVEVKNLLLKDNQLLNAINDAAGLCIDSLKNSGKIMFAGNGGSAADAQHLAGELVNRFCFDRPALAAISLTTDPSVVTSISNDFSFSKVIARQVEALGNRNDVLIVISTSGNSSNILEGIEAARKKGIKVIGLTGKSGGRMKGLCDILINVPSDNTPRIQETHILTGHIICALIETAIFGHGNAVE
ncbi:MAG TPA: D-sedoheptulose 7-phosphate isomerase [Bacteroidales bacterium]|nr:D-sedoheptulose 7-phosphate isomerase [Bacteroidales bacterium]